MNIGQAVQLCKGYAKQHRAVLAVADVLEGLDDLDVEKRRFMSRIKELNDDHKKYTDETNMALHKLQETKKKLANSEKEAKDILIDTKVQVDENIRDGKRVVEKLIDDAQALAKNKLEEVEKTVSSYKHEMAVMQAAKKTLQNEIHILDVELAKMKERLGF